MIKVDIYSNEQGLINRYTVSGHAESVEDGFDPVCGLVSLATQSPILGLQQHLHKQIKINIDKEKGDLEVELVDTPDQCTEAILATMACAVAELEQSFPKFLYTKRHRR